jgi:predicted GIY-YIG superfamily endonuclease
MYYVYLLECQHDKSWYIGYSDNLKSAFKIIKVAMVAELLQ